MSGRRLLPGLLVTIGAWARGEETPTAWSLSPTMETRATVDGRPQGSLLAAPEGILTCDLNADGAADVVAYGGSSGGGVVVIHLGDPRNVRSGPARGRPFRTDGTSLGLPFVPAMAVAGDFDADGDLDVACAERGGRALHLLVGDGSGRLSRGKSRRLADGAVTAMHAADLDRRDGIADLAVAVAAPPRVGLFPSAGGAFAAEPRWRDLPAPASALASGWLDDDPWPDLVAAAGDSVVILPGRDHALGRTEATTRRVPATGEARDVVAGDFDGDGRHDVAVLDARGAVHVVRHRGGIATLFPAVAGTRLLAGRFSGREGADILVTGRDEIATVDRTPAMREPGRPAGEIRRAAGAVIVAAAAARLDADGVSDVVVLRADGEMEVLVSFVDFTFVVTSSADAADAVPGDGACDDGTGACTLRAAVMETNALAGPDSIAFALPEPLLAAPIVLGASLVISDVLLIDGATQSPTLRVEIRSAGGPFHGFDVQASSVVLRGLAITGFVDPTFTQMTSAIRVGSGTGLIVEDVFVGLDVGGTSAVANQFGVLLEGGSDTQLGTASGVFIASGNQDGAIVDFAAVPRLRIENTRVGPDVNLTPVKIGSFGVYLTGVDATVGGSATGTAILVAGNPLDFSDPFTTGLAFDGAASGALVVNSRMGTPATGTAVIGDGISIFNGTDLTIGAPGAFGRNEVGGAGANAGISVFGGAGNLVQFASVGGHVGATATTPFPNKTHGVFVGAGAVTIFQSEILFNGDDPSESGVAMFGGQARISRTVFAANASLGIDLDVDGPTPNDPGDSDVGPNGLQNFPVITGTTTSCSSTVVFFELATQPGAVYTLEFFASAAADPSGFGEAERFIGSRTMIPPTVNATGTISLAPLPAGSVVTATATRNATGETSELGPAFTTPTPPLPGEVTGVAWTSATTLTFIPAPGSTCTNVHRSTLAQLPGLSSTAPDSCLRVTVTLGSANITELPPAGEVFFYLPVGVNAGGEGPAGSGASGPRILNSTGSCP